MDTIVYHCIPTDKATSKIMNSTPDPYSIDSLPATGLNPLRKGNIPRRQPYLKSIIFKGSATASSRPGPMSQRVSPECWAGHENPWQPQSNYGGPSSQTMKHDAADTATCHCQTANVPGVATLATTSPVCCMPCATSRSTAAQRRPAAELSSANVMSIPKDFSCRLHRYPFTTTLPPIMSFAFLLHVARLMSETQSPHSCEHGFSDFIHDSARKIMLTSKTQS